MRAFVAIELPEEIRLALQQEQSRFRQAAPEARWTRPEGVHLTLKFLGEIPDSQIAGVTEALQQVKSIEPFRVAAKGFGFFPDSRRPRVFWAGLEAPPQLAQLAAGVERALEPLGFPREKRAFSPHLTLARFKVPRAQPGLEQVLRERGEALLGKFEISEFFLWESKLSPRGARYQKVAGFPLPRKTNP